jgi:hypothetical protein
MPLEGDWQLPELARSVTLPMLRWPNSACSERLESHRQIGLMLSLGFCPFHGRDRTRPAAGYASRWTVTCMIWKERSTIDKGVLPCSKVIGYYFVP